MPRLTKEETIKVRYKNIPELLVEILEEVRKIRKGGEGK